MALHVFTVEEANRDAANTALASSYGADNFSVALRTGVSGAITHYACQVRGDSSVQTDFLAADASVEELATSEDTNGSFDDAVRDAGYEIHGKPEGYSQTNLVYNDNGTVKNVTFNDNGTTKNAVIKETLLA